MSEGTRRGMGDFSGDLGRLMEDIKTLASRAGDNMTISCHLTSSYSPACEGGGPGCGQLLLPADCQAPSAGSRSGCCSGSL